MILTMGGTLEFTRPPSDVPVSAFKLHIQSPITIMSGEWCTVNGEDKWAVQKIVVFHCTRPDVINVNEWCG